MPAPPAPVPALSLPQLQKASTSPSLGSISEEDESVLMEARRGLEENQQKAWYMEQRAYQQNGWSSAAMETRTSVATWAGRRAEDRVVAVCRRWPAEEEGSPVSAFSFFPCSPVAQRQMPQVYHLLAAFDGHNGAAAASFAAQSILQIVEQQLLLGGGLWQGAAGPLSLAAHLQEVVVQSFIELQRQFACTGAAGGCTATLVLQVGRLVTVGSVGSSRCMLLTGAGPWQELSTQHMLAVNPSERQRLVAAGCHLAEMDRGGCGLAPTPSSGDGVLRLWPGGLTLSRTIGDFNLQLNEDGLLPLPHVKQVLLPPTGGRLVLATDGIWSQANSGIRQAMHTPALKTVAHEVLKALHSGGSSHVDASIVVADVMPPGDSFPELCRRQQQQFQAQMQQQQQQQQRDAPSRLQRTLRRLVPSFHASPQPAHSAVSQVPQQAGASAPAAEVLADFDSAVVLGVAPAGSNTSSSSSGLGFSCANGVARRSFSGWAFSLPEPAGRTAPAAVQAAPAASTLAAVEEQPAPQPPSWEHAPSREEVLSLLAEAHGLWMLARRRKRAAETALAAAEAVAAVEAEWQAAAAGRQQAALAAQAAQASSSARLLRPAFATMRVPSLQHSNSGTSGSGRLVSPFEAARLSASSSRRSFLADVDEQIPSSGSGSSQLSLLQRSCSLSSSRSSSSSVSVAAPSTSALSADHARAPLPEEPLMQAYIHAASRLLHRSSSSLGRS